MRRRDEDEEVEVRGFTDRVRPAPGGGGNGDWGCLPLSGHLGGAVLQLAQEVRRTDAVGDATAEATRGREWQAEEACGGPLAGSCDAAGRLGKKALKPARRRQLMDDVRSAWEVSIRRACAVIRMEPSTYHYRGKRRSQAALIGRIKEIAATRVRYGYRRIHVLLRRGSTHCVGRRRLGGL